MWGWWEWREASGCRGLWAFPPPAVSQAHRAPFKSSRPSSGPGRDYSGLSRVDSSGTGADERNAPPRAGPPPLSTGWNGGHLRLRLGALCDLVLGHLAEVPAGQLPSLGFPACSVDSPPVSHGRRRLWECPRAPGRPQGSPSVLTGPRRGFCSGNS